MDDNQVRNMEEFASLSGISRPTLSKYFHDPASVRNSTRVRIEAALRQFDYRPNIYAINQNRRLTKNIGVVVPYLADPFFAEIARNIERLVIAAGFQPILLSAHGDRDQEIDILESLRSIKPAGVLLAPLGRASARADIARFCKHVPTVLFDSFVSDLGEAFIGSNNDQSIGLIVDYLCDTGEPPVFFEMRTPTNPNAIKRRKAYAKHMARRGHEAAFVQVPGTGWDFEEIGFREGARAIAERRLTTDTVLCSNDRLAIGFLAAAYAAGLRVGRGTNCALRVAGHDNHPFSIYTCPSLTTVSQDYAAIAATSVRTLFARMDEGPSPGRRDTELFDGALIVRDSA